MPVPDMVATDMRLTTMSSPTQSEDQQNASSATKGGRETSSNTQTNDMEVFNAYTASLLDRFYLTEPAALALQLTALSSAIGPCARIVTPDGHSLLPTLAFGLCGATAPYEAGIAMRMTLAALHAHRMNAAELRKQCGFQKIRAGYVEMLSELAMLERELATPEPPLPPPRYTFWTPDLDQVKAEREEARRAMKEMLESKRQEAAEIRAQLRPIVVMENAAWSELPDLGKLSFDNGFAAISSDGYMFESLSALSGRRLEAISGMLDPSRICAPAVNASGEMAAQAINYAFNIDYSILSRTLTRRRFVQSGVLDSFLFLDAVAEPGANMVNALETHDVDNQWNALMSKLFTHRVTGTMRTLLIDRSAYALFEQFRAWSGQQRFAGTPVHRFTRAWPDSLLKIALLFQILNGSAEDAVRAPAMERAVSVLTAMVKEHVRIVEKYADSAPQLDGIEGMIARVASVGRLTRRELFRRYHRKPYAQLQPVLDEAIAHGRLFFDGKFITMVPAGREAAADAAESVGVSASAAPSAEKWEAVSWQQ